MTQTTPSARRDTVVRRPIRVSRAGVLFVGVIGVPFALLAIFNSYGPLTDESAVRMAFASVAGQTVAVISGLTVLAVTISRRPGASQILIFAVITLVITGSALSVMATASDSLLTRLDLVAETNLPNR